MDSKMEKEWKFSNLKKTSHKNLLKIQLKMAFGVTNIMAFSKNRYFKVYFWRENLDETNRCPISYCALRDNRKGRDSARAN